MKTMLFLVCAIFFFLTSGHAQISFTEHTIDSYSNPWYIFGADIDDDDDIDAVSAGRLSNCISWWENIDNLNFTHHSISTVDYYAMGVYAVDIDDDDDMDILCASQIFGVELYENDGSQSFTYHIIADWGFANRLDVEDVDSDGDPDVLAVCCEAPSPMVGWIENQGNLNFTPHVVKDNWDNVNCVYAIDLDGDDDVDILASASQAGDISWFENDGSENFTEHVILHTLARPSSVYADDLDADGDIDVLATICALDQAVWFENDGDEGFTQHVIAQTFLRPHMIRSADMDDDGDLDVVGAAINSNKIAWWENNGSAPIQWTEHTITSIFLGATGIDVKDVDSDGDLDVLGAAQFGNSVRWWENDLNPGIEEGKYTTVEYFDRFPTVISGALPLKLLSEHRVLDITGRRIESDNPQPGVYFIVYDDQHVQKIIKVR
ncbi:MAG: VCBS repeat-containing protein [candidate division WOR-3 bacterium]|nr:MAG: VCBS repeat-containing protein [candidate division WOR-3 bacterium]